MSLLPAAVIGGLMGFLLYNVYPGKRIYGRTPDLLALGGFVHVCIYAADAVIYSDCGTDLSG